MAEGAVGIFRLGSLGDTIVALPCFHAIERQFGTSKRVLITNSPVSAKAPRIMSIIGPSGLVHGSIEFTSPLNGTAAIRLYEAVRAARLETIIYLGPRPKRKDFFRDIAFFRMAGVKRIIGGSLFRGLTPRRDSKSGEIEPETEFLARTLIDLGSIDLSDRSNWSLRLTDAEKKTANALVEPIVGRFIVVSTGGKVKKNNWGIENWLLALRELSKVHPALGLLVVGSSDERQMCERLLSSWVGPAVNAAGGLSPRETAAAMASAQCFLGHDSGPMHLAAAMGVRCVGLFGDNNPPRRWHPYGKGHEILHRMEGVSAIRIDEVVGAALRLLGAQQTG